METFRHETTIKYPTFAAPKPPPAATDTTVAKPPPPVPTAKLSQAYSPIPVRHHYHHDVSEDDSQSSHSFRSQSNSQYRGNPQPPTPAPSPPPSPKPKKKAYETDQSRPFLFPFSQSSRVGKDGKLIPFAIGEADMLYSRHMHVSLALMQMWRTREDCMTFESGLEHMPGSEGEFESSTFVKVWFLLQLMSGLYRIASSLGSGNVSAAT